MNASSDTLSSSYAACRRICRRAGSNFPGGFWLLPPDQRQAMEALYAFMRHTDDLADTPHPDHPAAAALIEWRAALEHALLGDGELQRHTGADAPNAREILPAVADTVQRFHVPPEHLRAVITGVECDVVGRRYETFAELERYCELVASAVGLACIHIWGFREGAAEVASAHARACGVAMQLTNILRDLRADAAEGRVYLPQEDLREHNYSVDDLLAGRADERFVRLVRFEAERAEDYYRRGAGLLELLPPASRRVFGLMTATYRALLRQIERRPERVLRERVRVGAWRKAWIALRWATLG